MPLCYSPQRNLSCPRRNLIYYSCMHLTEPLEPRVLLAANLSNGILKVSGSSGSDTISIALRNHAYKVNFNGSTTNFAASSVRTLTIRGNAGNDNITLSGKIKANTIIRGDSGDDS